MPLPDFLKIYEKPAGELLANGMVHDVEFSGGTYQVEVNDPNLKKNVWAFLQIDSRGQIKDGFCSCEDSEDVSSCVHLAAAYLRIFNHQTFPLHLRFERSLWNQLCRLYAERIGVDPDELKSSKKGQYASYSVSRKRVFFMEGKTAAAVSRLKEMIDRRPRETEETSLKFSNLSQEEIILWKEGRPSPQLKYELSYWNDLAKWLMFLEDTGEKYKLSFGYSSKNLPNMIFIDFPQIQLEFYLSEANLPLIIPSLAYIDSPLVVHNAEHESIKRMIYDRKERCLVIESKALTSPPKKENKKVSVEAEEHLLGNWIYIPGDGFYAKDYEGLFTPQKLCGPQISLALEEHYSLISSLLEGVKIHKNPIQASYALDFDADWNLHITCYVFSPGDLTEGESAYFGKWVYVEDDGFYRLEGQQFQQVEIVVPEEEVAEFVREQRTWLNLQEGFKAYLASIEAQMTYHLSEDGRLTFNRRVDVKGDTSETKDFGPWVYVAGQGFYSKVSSSIGLPLRPGVALGPDQIPIFIRMNQEELKIVPGFFSERCPVIKSGLIVSLENEEIIHVTPKYELLPDYEGKNVRFFDDFVYVEGEGFHELPVDSRLPERFRHPVTIENENQSLFLNYELDAIKQYTVEMDSHLIKADPLTLTAQSIERDEEMGKGWYAMKLHYQSPHGVVSVATLWTAIKEKKKYLFSDAGMIDLEEKRFDWIRILGKNRLDRRGNLISLSTLELIRLNAFDEIGVWKSKGKQASGSTELLKELTEFRIPSEPDMSGLSSSLRSYQEIGVRWLWFLYHHSLSGFLCDDMGLGKTHQAMALLTAVVNDLKNQNRTIKPRFLIICPTSVIYHWEEKLALFLPGMRVLTFHGGDRDLREFQNDYDVLLTSYGIWRIENERLSKHIFEIAVFDEVQIAKNQNSRVHSTLLNVHANMRLGLTGTPIENHLRELKALFDIVVPSYMPGDSDFREFFVKPIEKMEDAKRRQLLSRFIKPFVLRRKKETVLLDLPEKTEEVAHCTLLPQQELLYMEVLEKSRQKIMAELMEKETPIPFIHIFALLSALKQICNHPAAYLKDVENYKNYQSGKWELFVELLSEARESKQKVVIFSQYLAMLDIIEEHLNELGVGFASIRGSTVNRREQIRRFNHDPLCEVFTGSLQAAGLGIDLTAASVVIHYDRWWNAARENQATDRVHRIGQQRGVQVFKLVTKGTFEEKIDALIGKKGRLMEDIVGEDDQKVIKQFNRDEIIQLLQYTRLS